MTTKNDPMGDRLKGYEEDVRFDVHLPIIARLDGKAFHSWTSGLARPFDDRLRSAFTQATVALVEKTGARCGYTQSDEVTLVFKANGPDSDTFMGGRRDKMTSILASTMTAEFRQACPLVTKPFALFDCRVYQVPTDEEAANVLLWRFFDCRRNAILSAAQFRFGPKRIHGKTAKDCLEMMRVDGLDYAATYPERHRHGVLVQRSKVTGAFTSTEIERLPARHEARQNPDLQVERTAVLAEPMPDFSKVSNRVAVVMDGATWEFNS